MQTMLDGLWSLGTAGSATLVLYGAYLYCISLADSTPCVARVLSRLAMQDSARIGQSMDELRSELTRSA